MSNSSKSKGSSYCFVCSTHICHWFINCLASSCVGDSPFLTSLLLPTQSTRVSLPTSCCHSDVPRNLMLMRSSCGQNKSISTCSLIVSSLFLPDSFCCHCAYKLALQVNSCLCVIIVPPAHVVVCVWSHLHVEENASGHVGVLSSWTWTFPAYFLEIQTFLRAPTTAERD